ncbi:MarR family winged helix-turn-helix transcriptional regulator [Cryptosporangium arvum]|uniref:MarR family winged helix-turn-helix transcriptional regulator n=1 Tax=Cryptosporangium arvum TaxID=80871 RepID=UPI000685FFC6|nr:MarR family transcriptional regulator [Cryptosporangium arvum]
MHEHGAGAALVGLAALIHRRYSEICAVHDLTPAQAQLLCMLKDRPRGLTELSRLLGLARPGLSGLVDRIERRGLVQRDNPAHDRRAVTLSTTPLGQQIVDALYVDITSQLPDLLDDVAPDDRRIFERVASDIAAGGGFPGTCGGSCPTAAG